jgi:tetratricopeptide (TPR) repeat protein
VGPTTSTVGAVVPGSIRKPAVPARRSVAVLGFRNVSGRADEAWVATALSEMLTTELAAGEKLRTVSGENVARMKADLSLPEADSYAADTLGKMRQTVGADYIVLGSYVPMGKPGERKLRIDLRLEDASAGQVAAAVSQSGSLENLDDLVSKVGADLRSKLGVEEISAAETKMVRAALPSNSEAARFYAEGLSKLRQYDTVGGRDLLKKATIAEPSFPSAHSLLAGALASLGYDEEARAEAKKALDLSGSVSRETRLLIEGQYRQANHERRKAIEVYQTLFNFFPDNLDYGLSLAQALVNGGKGKESLEVIQALRNLPPPSGSSPRIDIAEARAAAAIGDFQRELAAGLRAEKAGRATEQKVLTARALGAQAHAYQNTGQAARALEVAKDERALYAAAHDKEGEGFALVDTAVALRSTSGPAQALTADEQALAIFRDVGSKRQVGVALNNIADEVILLGDMKRAVRLWKEELAICREIDDKPGIAAAQANIGAGLFVSGDLRGSQKSAEQAVGTNKKLGDKHGMSQDLQILADALASLGRLDEAAKDEKLALAAARETQDKSTEAAVLSGLGRISEKRGELAEARRYYSDALSLQNAISEKSTAAESSVALANLSIEDGAPEKAPGLLAGPKAEFAKEQLADDELLADATWAKACLAMGKPGEAMAQLEAAKSLLPRVQDRSVHLALGIVRGRGLGKTGRVSEGAAVLREIRREAESAGFVSQALEARLALAELELESGKTSAGRTDLAAVQADAAAKGFLLIARKAAAALQRSRA